MTTIIAHNAQVVLVDPGTVVQDTQGRTDTVTEEHGAQIGTTFFMTKGAWKETISKDPKVQALVLTPATI